MERLLTLDKGVFLLCHECLQCVHIYHTLSIKDKVPDLVFFQGTIGSIRLAAKIEDTFLEITFVSLLREQIDIEEGPLADFVIAIC